jgi:succinyl-CoA synthetase beta subunit
MVIMNLYEYMGKQIFEKYGIPVPGGYVINNVNELKKYDSRCDKVTDFIRQKRKSRRY